MTVGGTFAGRPEISIVLPVHNDAEFLRDVVGSYIEMLDRLGRQYELILVTNACTDESLAVATALAQESPSIVSVDLERGGWGRAVRAGLRQAYGSSLCYTNLARTSAPMLGLLISYSLAYPDVVVKASRKVRDSWRRRLGSLLYNLECRALFDVAAWDINGTPKVFPRAFSGLLELQRDDDLIDAEFVMRCRREGHPIVDVPIIATTRHGGRSTTGYRSALRMYTGAIRLWLTQRPR